MPGRIYDATWGRLFALGYDAFLAGTERAGLAEMRRDLLAQARGRTIELGAGTGLNLEHYPGSVDELVLTEPDPHMARKLHARAGESGRRVEVVEAPAESLPFEDASFDTAVVTLVLCTVPDPEAALAEVVRVVRPGGRFLFLEHVRSEDPSLARWQDRLHRPWRLFGDGCNCNRASHATIAATPGLEVETERHGDLPKAVPIVKPLVVGAAVRTAA